MAGIELRRVPEQEALAFARVAELAFGEVATDEVARETVDECYDPGWAIGVYDGGELVATTSAVGLELTLPAGPGPAFPLVAVPGVTAVSVLPTHRRRGLLSRMMAYQLETFREREVPLAILTASESAIYGRYGYGLASSYQSLAIATKRSGFLGTTWQDDSGPGQLRLVDAADAGKLLPDAHDRARRLRPGEITRSQDHWARILADPERHRHGGGARMYVVHYGEGGEVDGYASYRYQRKWEAGLPGHTVAVEDIYSVSPVAHAALWRFLLDIDLVEEVTVGKRPIDEPLRWWLADPRRLRTTSFCDFLWARLVDVPRALASRGYGTETELVLELTGPATERYWLATSSSAGSCRRARAGESADVVLGLGELGAIYLGGCRPSALAGAGRVREARPGALVRADGAFASPLAPFCGTGF
ncbi:MAG: GNAT family N-acetyltransferase [Acidimicrobiales bacterium]